MENNQFENQSFLKEQPEESSLSTLSVVMIVLFCFIIGAVSVFFVFSSDKEMSESENRMLAKRPALSFSAIADGSFMKDFESWLADQFPLREEIIEMKTKADRIMGVKEKNGVYIGKNGFLFEKQSEFDEEKVTAMIESVNSFSKKHKNLKQAFVLSPNSSCLLWEELPDYVVPESQKLQLGVIKDELSKGKAAYIDCLSAFEAEEDKAALFYKTDHHWTTRGAYKAFTLLMKKWGFKVKDENYQFRTVSNSFMGTLSSSSQVRDCADAVEICFAVKPEVSSVIYYESQGTKTATFFDKTKLEKQNHYEVFMGGNFDKIIISTSAETDRTLLVLKDSYANCMIPMLAPYFSKIVVVDPRYCSDKISEIMKDYDFTHLVFIYNLNTFLEDTTLEGFLKK